jgi:hypothetical protein
MHKHNKHRETELSVASHSGQSLVGKKTADFLSRPTGTVRFQSVQTFSDGAATKQFVNSVYVVWSFKTLPTRYVSPGDDPRKPVSMKPNPLTTGI